MFIRKTVYTTTILMALAAPAMADQNIVGGSPNGSQVTVFGDNNQAQFTQNGFQNTAYGNIVGNNSSLLIEQVGDDNYGEINADAYASQNFANDHSNFAIIQHGTSNAAGIRLAGGPGNESLVTQTGNNNLALVGSTYGYANAPYSETNKSVVTQVGDTHKATIETNMTNFNTRSTIVQQGGSNDSATIVYGLPWNYNYTHLDNNEARIMQTGEYGYNTADITIDGPGGQPVEGNLASIEQNGNGNQASVTLWGNFNVAHITQSGDLNRTGVAVGGNNNAVNIAQH